MSINTALLSSLYTGLQGFNQAEQGVAQAANDINRATQEQQTAPSSAVETVVAQPPVKLDQALVDLKVEQFHAQANAKTIQTADEVLGTMIDVRV